MNEEGFSRGVDPGRAPLTGMLSLLSSLGSLLFKVSSPHTHLQLILITRLIPCKLSHPLSLLSLPFALELGLGWVT